ncbi:sulfite exporter TauE/SafE family protein [Pseudonocardiaceae bacterium YIM PH 21723]|nr:sulfite exporter TauE/SafE family protein [Pseudonocardiaceae bacterium YIM PH 21723]
MVDLRVGSVTTVLGWPGFADVTLAGLIFLCVAAFAAGLVDAVCGGGGLIQLPALLLVLPGGDPIYSLAVGKISSGSGTAAALRTYAGKVDIDWRRTTPMAVLAFAGSIGGAAVADMLPADVLKVFVMVALVGVGIYTWRQPNLGELEVDKLTPRRQIAAMCAAGLVIGLYDGALGPGTGSFLVFFFVGVIGYAFLRASAATKVINLGTNLGGLLYFAVAGKVLWGLGISMAVCNMAGGMVGSAIAVRYGSSFVRKVFLVVVGGLIVTLGGRALLGI